MNIAEKIQLVLHILKWRMTWNQKDLTYKAAGIDIQKDIMENCPMKVILPESGKVAVTDPSIVTGNGFTLHWGIC